MEMSNEQNDRQDGLVAELKAKYGSIYQLNIALDDEETTYASIFLRKMDRLTYSAVSKLVQADELQATEVLLKNLYVGGDDLSLITGKDSFEALRSASVQVANMLKVRGGELKKI